jgi:hypothetical protein
MKGHTNNPNGRPKGTPNKLTSELRDTLKALIDIELENLPGVLAELPARERAELVVKLLPYVLPKVEPAPFHIGEPFSESLMDGF